MTDVNPSHSSHFVVIGEGTAFSSEAMAKGTGLRDIKDGSSNTIMIVNARRNIPWSKPADLQLDDILNSYRTRGLGVVKSYFDAGLADGSVLLMQDSLEADRLKNWLRINDKK